MLWTFNKPCKILQILQRYCRAKSPELVSYKFQKMHKFSKFKYFQLLLIFKKHNFAATTTAKRIRHEARTTLRRRTSSRSYYASTARRMSMNIHDAAVSMLPDLSENLSNEESTWEEIMQIKAMPVCMAQKIQLKKQLQVSFCKCSTFCKISN